MRTTVRYCRKGEARGYQVVETATGKVLAQLGTGASEKYRAERFQLQVEHPRVLRLADRVVSRYPELKRRALRAAVLYVEGHVHPNGAEHGFDVDSQSGERRYEVDLNFNTCTCPDWEGALVARHHSAPWCNGQPMCKHLVAARMFERLT